VLIHARLTSIPGFPAYTSARFNQFGGPLRRAKWEKVVTQEWFNFWCTVAFHEPKEGIKSFNSITLS